MEGLLSFLCPVWGSGVLWVSHHQMPRGGCSLPSCTGMGWAAHRADHLSMQPWMRWALRPEAGNEWELLVGPVGRCEPERGWKLPKQRPFAWSGRSWVGMVAKTRLLGRTQAGSECGGPQTRGCRLSQGHRRKLRGFDTEGF